MLISTFLISILVPMQIDFRVPEGRGLNPYWVASASIDAVRIFGLPSFRNKIPLINHNPELSLRDEIKEDKSLTRRRQFIQDYVTNSVTVATR